MSRHRLEEDYDYHQRCELEKQLTTREWVNKLNKSKYAETSSYQNVNVKRSPGARAARGFKDYSTGFLQYKSSVRAVNGRNDRRRGHSHEDDLAPPLSQVEIEAIRRCFEMADVERTGYLDCEGLKIFMEYRKTPITHMEAKNLIRKSDPEYNYYITLEQIMTLAFNCGLGTESERKISSTSYTNVIRGLNHYSRNTAPMGNKNDDRSSHPQTPFQSNVVEENLKLDGTISYFEDIAISAEDTVTEENLYYEYRRDVRDRKSPNNLKDTNYNGILPPPPGWSTMVLHSRDPTCFEPQRSVNILKTEWEQKWPKPPVEVEIEPKNSLDKIKFRKPVPLGKCKELTHKRTNKVMPPIALPSKSTVAKEKWALVPYVKSEESANIILHPSPTSFDDKISRQEIL